MKSRLRYHLITRIFSMAFIVGFMSPGFYLPVNTDRVEYVDSGMNHTEGGWPKDINFNDPEQTLRFRKKIEKDEMYIHTVQQLLVPMENCIHQNNAINIYELFFTDCEQPNLFERSHSRTVTVFRDPCSVKRPVTHICWSPDQGSRLAVTHTNLKFQRALPDQSHFSYIWLVENPNKPEMVIDAGNPLICLEYNPRDANCLAGGLYNGQVAYWDIRRGATPVEISDHFYSFHDSVMNVIWINSKSGMEFFSASTDGQIKWWDIRKLASPVETLIVDITKGEEQSIVRALGVSCLEYEPTIPTRFMIGTEKGMVIAGNRKGKTPAEKLTSHYKAHHGPVWSLQRNPTFLKNFLTIGDWTARIWSEDCKESSIIWTSYHKNMLTKGMWSPTRPSVFILAKVDGTLDVWDILQQQQEPTISIKVCDEALVALRYKECGKIIGIGTEAGTTYVKEFSENLVRGDKNDKALLTAMFERESRREKIIEGKMREQRLRLRARQQQENAQWQKEQAPPTVPVRDVIKIATDEFFAAVGKMEEEIKMSVEDH